MTQVDARRGRRPGQTRRVTLKAVAEAAGVSMMTVSNVIHNRVNVSAAIREQVEKQIKDLGYVPNRAAQELAGAARPHFGLLYPGVINPFIAAVIVGSMKAAARLRVDVTVQLAQLGDTKALRDTIQRMELSGVDGFLLPSPMAEFVASTYRKKPVEVPVVAIAPGHPMPGMGSVRCDEKQAAYDLVSLLAENGHERIGHLAGPETQSGSTARLEGWRQALKAQRLKASPELVVRSESYRFQDGVKAAEVLLAREPRVTAVFAANDTLAAAVIATAHRLGIEVPRQLSVVGYDDAPVAEQVWPGLTTIHQDAEVMTEQAVELLEKAVRAWRADRSELPGEDIVLPYQIVRRGSVAPPG